MKLPQSKTSLICELGGVCTEIGFCAFDVQAHCPEIAIIILVVQLAVFGRNDTQSFSERVTDLGFDVFGDKSDVFHHRGNVGENNMILALQDVIRLIFPVQICEEGVIDESFTERFHLCDRSRTFELSCDGIEFLTGHNAI